MTARGSALPLTLLVLAVTGTLAAGIVWVSLLEARSGRNAVRLVQAQTAAETGAVRAMSETARRALESLGAGDAVAVQGDLGLAGSYRGAIRALGSGVFAVAVRGEAPGRTGRQTVVILAEFGDSTGLAPLESRGWVWTR